MVQELFKTLLPVIGLIRTFPSSSSFVDSFCISSFLDASLDDEEDIAVATEYFWDDEEEAGFDESDFSLDSADAKKVGFSLINYKKNENALVINHSITEMNKIK